MELRARHEGRSQCVDVTRNDDGTFTFTIIATIGGGNTELKFTTEPGYRFDLGVFEGHLQNNAGGVVVVDIPEFQLKISGYMKPDARNIYLTQEPVSSPHGRGKDECGNDLQPKGQ
jgi:hypothetical protein